MQARAVKSTPSRATCSNLREIAQAYMPSLLFAAHEQFYPILAESWLTHATSADWPETTPARGSDLLVDTGRHGTALVTQDGDPPRLTLHAGTPRHNAPMALTPDVMSNGVGLLPQATPNHFLVFGGWSDPDTRTRGHPQYLAQAFSEMGSALSNQVVPWNPVELDGAVGHLPQFWTPQPVTPTVYAEFEWAGRYPAWCQEFGEREFTGAGSALDDLVCLTYYFLYPHRQPPRAGQAPVPLEGQWEAVSIFFRCTAASERRNDGRPTFVDILEPPLYVVASQNLEGGVHQGEVKPWDKTEKIPLPDILNGTAFVLYVSQGNHAMYFHPVEGESRPLEPSNPVADINLDFDEDRFWWQLLFVVLVLLLAAHVTADAWLAIQAFTTAWLAPLAAVLLTILAILAILLLVLAVAALFADHGSELQPRVRNDLAMGDGPALGSPHEAPAGLPSDSSAPSERPLGTPNAGSPSGHDNVAFDVRLVDRLNEHHEYSQFPPLMPCENPAWWHYPGHWGIRVTPRVDDGWADGMRRVDHHQRSWGYYNAAHLVEFIDRASVAAREEELI